MLLVSSSRYPDQWIVPGGGMEPEEEPGGAAVREVYEEVTKKFLLLHCRMAEVGKEKDLWRSPPILAQAEPPRACCPGSCPDGS